MGMIDKYKLYSRAVQSPEADVDFLIQVYKELTGKKPKVLREDFCAAGLLCTEWVKKHKDHKAYGIDLDPEPLRYGETHYVARLSASQKARVQLLNKNVLNKNIPHADLAIALNFSYSLFKKREDLKKYFKNAHQTLKRGGLMVVDTFGGSQCYDAITDRTLHRNFTYYWEQEGFDPVTNQAIFHIHFKVGRQMIKKAFTYDWRLWSIPELRELMEEVGFKKTHVYWEGTTRNGTGNGVFKRVEQGEACESWISYVVGEKS